MRTVDEWQVCFMELLRVRRAAPLTAELGDARAEGEAAMRTVDEWQVCSLDKGDSMNEVHVFDDILEAQGFLVGLPAPVCHEGGIWEGRHIMRHVVRHYRGDERDAARAVERSRITAKLRVCARELRASGTVHDAEEADGMLNAAEYIEDSDASACPEPERELGTRAAEAERERDEARRALLKAEDRARSFQDGWQKHRAAVSAMCQRLGADFERQPCDVSTLGATVETLRRVVATVMGERDAARAEIATLIAELGDARRDASSGLLPGLLESGS